MSDASPVRVPVAELEAFIARVFVAAGIRNPDARTSEGLMALADVQGAEGHGILRRPQYVRRINGGAVNLRPNIRLVREAAGRGLVDGDNGMGHLVMRFATQTAIAKAKSAG